MKIMLAKVKIRLDLHRKKKNKKKLCNLPSICQLFPFHNVLRLNIQTPPSHSSSQRKLHKYPILQPLLESQFIINLDKGM